jgi:hypothetical protein
MTHSTLAQLTDGWDAFFRDVDTNLGALTPELEQTHAVLQLDTARKVDGYIIRLKKLKADGEGVKALAAELTSRCKALERTSDWLKERVAAHMARLNLKELRGETLQGFKLQPAGGMRAIEMAVTDYRAWPIEFWNAPTVNTEKVRSYLEAHPGGEQIVTEYANDLWPKGALLARLKPRGEVLRYYV